MFYSVIIVEDEYLPRQKLMQSVDWEHYQCKVVYDCESAEEAMDFVEQNGFPDILFTDIKLLHQSGIELCKYFYEKNPQTKKVIMTGYDYFDYAKQAIQYEVNNYSLKPITSGNMEEILQKLIREILIQRHSHQELAELRLFVKNNRRALAENLLVELSSNNIYDVASYAHQAEKLGVNLVNYYYVIVNYKSQMKENSLETKLQLKNFLEEQLSFYGDCYCFSFEYQRICCVMIPGKTSLKLVEILEAILNKIPMFNERLTFSAGISLMQQDYAAIRKAYEQANTAVSYDFYFGPGSILQYQDISSNSMNNPSSFETFDSEDIIANLRLGDWGTCQTILNYKFETMKQEKTITLQVLQTSAIELITTIYNSVYANSAQYTAPNPTDEIYRITLSSSLEEIHHILEDIIKTCGMMVQTRFLNHTHSAVMKILDYINEHYQEQITLENLSKIVYLNTKYICNIIKKDTGKTFHEILVGIRIEKAKQLMDNTSYKMYEISQLVGFYDTKAFNGAFKKHTGMTPTEYHKQIKR